jgi:hypothetical protein
MSAIRIRLLIPAVVMLLLTLGSGWLHGRLVQRWGQTDALAAAAAKLTGGLPLQLGNWRQTRTRKLEAEVARVLQCVGHLEGEYKNDQTGDTIVVAVVAGPGGPISVHSPEICYSAQDFELAGDRRLVTIEDNAHRRHTFWQIDMHARDVGRRENLRLLYAWSRGNAWEAASGPRFAFAGVPVLYKLQLAGPPNSNSTPTAISLDACQDFLSHFLPSIQARLVNTSQVAPNTPQSPRKEP